MVYLHRLSLFKLPDEAQQEEFVSQYRNVKDIAEKDGERYIVACDVGRAADDQRRQGFTVAAHTVFKSQDDFDYYDKHCPAHKKLREYIQTRHKGFVMLYFTTETI